MNLPKRWAMSAAERLEMQYKLAALRSDSLGPSREKSGAAADKIDIATAAATNISNQRFGFVGVGMMATAIVRGICSLKESKPPTLVLSPRGIDNVAGLVKSFGDMLIVATSNQRVLDTSEVIFIGVLPAQCVEVLRSLTFKPHHIIVSLASSISIATLRENARGEGGVRLPGSHFLRAIPEPTVALHRGVCLLYPPSPLTEAFFAPLGTIVAVETESKLLKVCVRPTHP